MQLDDSAIVRVSSSVASSRRLSDEMLTCPVAHLEAGKGRACSATLDRSTVKHAFQNTQNDCHHWFSRRFKVHRICFRPGSAPDPAIGELAALPQTS